MINDGEDSAWKSGERAIELSQVHQQLLLCLARVLPCPHLLTSYWQIVVFLAPQGGQPVIVLRLGS